MDNSEELLNNNKEEKKCYYCASCETNFVSHTNLEKCFFCNSELQININRRSARYNYIIPFRKTKKDFMSLLKKHISKKIFISNKFNISKNINNIFSIYVPVWLFDFETNGEVNFECKKITKFKSKKNKYVKTDSHLVTIGGSMNFSNVEIYTSKININRQNEVFSSFNYNELKEFENSYLNDYVLEEPSLEIKDTTNLGELSVKEMFIEKLQKEINNYDSCDIQDSSINLNNTKKQCVLVPLWLFTVDYKGKVYNMVCNGQTGKIFENIPISIKKVFFIWLLLFVISFSLLFILFNYKVII